MLRESARDSIGDHDRPRWRSMASHALPVSAWRLFVILVGGKWQVALYVLSCRIRPISITPALNGSVQKEVTSATAGPGNMEGAGARHDLLAGFRPSYVGTVRKFTDRLHFRVPVQSRLPGSEIFFRPLEDVREIELCRSAEANTPSSCDHEFSFGCARIVFRRAHSYKNRDPRCRRIP